MSNNSSENSKFQKNLVLGNDDNDIEESAANCGTNTYKGNYFGTSEADSVPSPACIR